MNTKIIAVVLGCLASMQMSSYSQQVMVQSNKWSIRWTNTVNPVSLSGPGGAYKPYVLYNNAWPTSSRYRVWYDGNGTTNTGLAYSYSGDGINWSAGVALTGLNTAASSVNGSNFAGSAVMLFEPGWAKPFRLYY